MTDSHKIDPEEIERNADLVAKIVANSIAHIARCLEIRQRQATRPNDVATLGPQLEQQLLAQVVESFSKKTNDPKMSDDAQRSINLTETTQKAFARSALVEIVGRFNNNRESNVAKFALSR